MINLKNMKPKDPILQLKMDKKNLQDVMGVNCLTVPRVRKTKSTNIKMSCDMTKPTK